MPALVAGIYGFLASLQLKDLDVPGQNNKPGHDAEMNGSM